MAGLQSRVLRHFDYVGIARDAGMTEAELSAIERGTRAEYGSDDMLYELRMLRTCRAIRNHQTTVQHVLAELRDSEASAA
jgi:hypothetical protein